MKQSANSFLDIALAGALPQFFTIYLLKMKFANTFLDRFLANTLGAMCLFVLVETYVCLAYKIPFGSHLQIYFTGTDIPFVPVALLIGVLLFSIFNNPK